MHYESAWENDPGYIIHLVNLVFELPFIQWLEFLDVGVTPLCKMCANLCKEAQMALAKIWAEYETKWLQDRVEFLQQV